MAITSLHEKVRLYLCVDGRRAGGSILSHVAKFTRKVLPIA